MRNDPPASPGIAASQNSCIDVNSNPMLGSRTTKTLIKNHVLNESINATVVIMSVRQAMLLPVSFQNPGSSGSHVCIQVFTYIYVVSLNNSPGKREKIMITRIPSNIIRRVDSRTGDRHTV